MLRVSVDQIQPGMVLARPIPMPNDVRSVLLQRDQKIPMEMIPRLKQLNILDVWIRHRDLEFLEDLIDENVSESQREVYYHVRQNFEKVLAGATAGMDFKKFQSSIGDLFHCLKNSNCGNVLLQKLDAFDNYLVSHSANVCYLAMLIGMKIDEYLIQERKFKTAKEAKDIQDLGLGCLLHDVGKMKVPMDILNKPARLTDKEMEIMKLHPVYGHEMVRGNVPPAASDVVLNHHQRFRGDGYPGRKDARTGEPLPPLAGKQISVFSRIATIADIYDAATSQRCYSGAKPPVRVLHEMRTYCQGFFDPVVENAFYSIIPPFPIGKIVTLSNGMEAVVVDFNPEHPVRPKVQGLRDPNGVRFQDPSLEEYDLAFYDDIEIVAVDGIDVRGFQETLKVPLSATAQAV